MGTMNRAFNKVKNWFKSPSRTAASMINMPTNRMMTDPVIQRPQTAIRRISSSGVQKRINRRRAANKVARRSRRINRLVSG